MAASAASSRQASHRASGYSTTSGKTQRGDEGVEQAAERPADGQPEEELGEAFRAWPVAGQLAVTDHAGREEDGQVQAEGQPMPSGAPDSTR